MAGGEFAKTTRKNGVVSYQGEIKAPKKAGDYTMQIIGPPGVMYFGRAKVTVVEAKPEPK